MSEKPYNPGTMRDLIVLQQPSITRLPDGSESKNWDSGTNLSVHAAFATVSGREWFQAHSVTAELENLITIRWVAGLDSTWRVLFNDPRNNQSKTFDILAVVNPDQRRRFLQLHCKEIVGREIET